MDSILLLEKFGGCYGKLCTISVSTGAEYVGRYRGAEAFNQDAPLVVKLEISEAEASRIGTPHLRLIGIQYDLIIKIEVRNEE